MNERMLFWLWFFCLSIISGSSDVDFTVSLGQNRILFGEELEAWIQIKTSQTLIDPMVEIHVPQTLDFQGNMSVKLCTEGKKPKCYTVTEHMKPSNGELNDLPLHFPNETITDSRFYSVINFLDRLEPIQLTFDFSGLKPEESHAYEPNILDWWALFGINVYADSMMGLRTRAKIDSRALPLVLEIPLPPSTRFRGKRRAVNVTNTRVTLNGQLLNLPLNSTSDDGDVFSYELQGSDELTGAMSQCDGGQSKGGSSKCDLAIEMHMQVMKAEVEEGQFLNFSARGRYGPELEHSVQTRQVPAKVVGADLEVIFDLNPADVLFEAGDSLEGQVVLRHSKASTEGLVVQKVLVVLPQNSGVEYVEGSGEILNNSRKGWIPLSHSMFNTMDGIYGGVIGQTQKIEIRFKLQLTDQLPIGSTIPIYVFANYTSKLQGNSSCLPAVCKNGGVCLNWDVNKCLCPEGYTAPDCSERVCKTGWMSGFRSENSETCYIAGDTEMTLENAEDYCLSIGGHLPSIHSLAEQKRIEEFRSEHLKDANMIWIGLRREEGAWQWVDSTQINYTNWNPGSLLKENCAALRVEIAQSKTWYSSNCSTKLLFICQDSGDSRVNPMFTRKNVALLKVKDLALSDIELGLPTTLRIHQPVTSVMKLNIPRGMLNNVELTFEFISLQLSRIPVKFLESHLSPHKGLKMSNESLVKIKEGGFSHSVRKQSSGQRHKRAISSGTELTVNRPIGTLSHPSNIPSMLSLQIDTTFVAEDAPPDLDALFTLNVWLGYNQLAFMLGSQVAQFGEPILLFQKHLRKSETEGEAVVEVVIKHAWNSSAGAYDLNFEDQLDELKVLRLPSDAVEGIADGFMLVEKHALEIGDQLNLKYKIVPQQGMVYGRSYRNASLSYASIRKEEKGNEQYPGKLYGPVAVSTCLERQPDVAVAQQAHLHLVSLLAFCLVFFGSLFATLLFLWCYYKKHKKGTAISPVENVGIAGSLLGPEDGAKLANSLNGSFEPAKENHTVFGTSIMPVLTSESNSTALERLDRMDIHMIGVYEDMLDEQKLRLIRDVVVSHSEQTAHGSGKVLNARLCADFEQLEREFRTKLRRLKLKWVDRKERDKNKCADLESSLQQRSFKQRMALRNFMLHKVALEEESELQQLKKEIQASKERVLSDAANAISSENADENAATETIARINKAVDAEKGHGLKVLKSHLLRRKEFALKERLNESVKFKSLDKILASYTSAVKEHAKKGILTSFESVDTALKKEYKSVINLLNERKNAVYVKLNKQSKDLRAEKENQMIKAQKRESGAKEKSTSNLKIDERLSESRMLREKQQTDLYELDESLDGKDAEMLRIENEKLCKDMESRLKEALDSVLRTQGITETPDLSALVKENLEKQKRELMLQKEKQLQKLEKTMKMRRKQESETEQVVKKLLDNHGAVSEEEREQILASLANFQNRLVLDEVRQKLELAKKLELRKANAAELTADEEDGGPGSSSGQNQLLQIGTDSTDVESTIVDDQKLEEDHLASELRISTLLASLQLTKAKQLSHLEEQEEALVALRTCLVEDMNTRNVLSNPETHHILEQHRNDRKKITEHLEEQRAKQEQTLINQLEERAQKKQAELKEHETEAMESLSKNATDLNQSLSAVDFINARAIEGRQLKHSDAIAISQQLGECRRAFRLKKKELVQDQEVKFLNNLVDRGNFKKGEVARLLRLLFPHRSRKDLKQLRKQLQVEDELVVQSQTGSSSIRPKTGDSETRSVLLERKLLQTQAIMAPDSDRSEIDRQLMEIQNSQFSKNSLLPPLSKRPEPVGASVDEVAEYIPPKILPPNIMKTHHS